MSTWGLPLIALCAAGTAMAQETGNPFGQQPAPGAQPAPPAQPGQPFGQPQPQPGFGPGGQPGPGQGPGGQPQPGMQPQPQPQPGFDGNAGFNGQASFGAGATGADAAGGVAADAPTDEKLEEEERAYSLIEQTNLYGSTGFLRTSYAGSGASGTFRVSFLMDWFSTSGFLCDPTVRTAAVQGRPGERVICGPAGTLTDAQLEDSASHVGAFFTLNATPAKFLEAYASIRTFANQNDKGTPPLLQVLGDTTFGVKLFSPNPGKLFHFGGELQLMLLNGTGGVGLAGGGTSAALRALSSLDFRKPGGKGFPMRINANLGYKIDNSANVVEDIEIERAKRAGVQQDATERAEGTEPRLPISRIERFGLGINRVDFFQIHLGAGIMWSKIQPFLEYTLDLPVNRQGWTCHTGRVAQGDVCLGLDNFSSSTLDNPDGDGGTGYSAVPSRLSLGVRATPFTKAFRGLSATAAFDIGLSATSTFIEEVAPQAPWTLYLGLGYAYDTKEKAPPPAPPAPPAPLPTTIAAPQSYARGFVHEQGKDTPVVEAIVTIEGPSAQAPVATGPDGRFLTRHLEPGSYTFAIKAAGFKPGQCVANIAPRGAPGAAGPGAGPGAMGPGGQPGQPGQPFGAQPGQPFGAQPGQPFGPGQQPQPGPPMGGPGAPPAAPPSGPMFVDVDCPLEALPKLGLITGTVKDAESGAAVAGAVVKMTDASGKANSATADGNGVFSFKDLQPGVVKFRVDAQGYMTHANETEVRANEEARPTLSVNKRPKVALVKIQGN
ncbi:MAG: carboxypeptidase-like regulatory domain-containing protein, partial [Polyangiaceae bacterium]